MMLALLRPNVALCQACLLGAIALLIALPNQALATDGCYAREYSASHLAQHPDQTVTSMALGLRAQKDDPKLFDGAIAVTVRGSDRRRLTVGICEPTGRNSFDCGIECDGGSFQLRPSSRKGSMRLILQRIYFDGGCGFDAGAGNGYELTAGKDDKLFRLDPSANARCKALFEEIDRQGFAADAAN
ncbi:MAG: hypothetical protein AAF354_09890 [Pseudomonadota bacterium]